jgi:dihydroorotase
MLLKDCRIVGSTGVYRGDILIEDGKIARIGSLPGRGQRDRVNIKGAFVIPGLVDMHVHMRDFNERYKEDFLSGSRAALAGGVTSFVDMPNSRPPVVDPQTFLRRQEAARRSSADYGLAYGVTEDNVSAAADNPAILFKIYLDGSLGEITTATLEQAVSALPRTAVHAEDPELIRDDHRPVEAEERAVRRIGQVAQRLRRNVHVCHVSSAAALNALNSYTTSEVTPHHLLLTQEDVRELGGVARVNPPLRTSRDARALLLGLKSGRINAIASDHAPHARREKDRDYGKALPGIPGLESMLRLLLTMVHEKKISLPELVLWCCENPSELLGLESKGRIAPGMDADIVVLDMNKKGRIEGDEFYSKAKETPFEGKKVRGDVDRVILRGQMVYEEGEVIGKMGYGKPLKFSPPPQ